MKTLLIGLLLISSTADARQYDTLKAVYAEVKGTGLDINHVLQIAYTESRFNPHALRVNKNGTIDVGMFQINSVHFSGICADLDVMTVKGNTQCAIKLIKEAKKHSRHDKNWLGRYHSKTPSRKLNYVNLLNNVPKRVLKGL
jgi:hypothetical protein